MVVTRDLLVPFFDDMILFAQHMVRTPSLSGQEDKVADLVRREMEKLGYDMVYTDKAGNVIGIIEPGSPVKPDSSVVLLNGHMDHVDPGDLSQWKKPPYSGEIIDGCLWGRGSADMKAALAAMIYAAGVIKKLGVPRDNRIIVNAVVYEEYTEGLGQRIICEEGKCLRFDKVILGEGTNLDVSVGHRGRAELELTIRGVASHASMPDQGVNAVYPIATLIEYLRRIEQAYPSDPLTGKESVALTHISCSPGIGPIVPDTCYVRLDRRLIPRTSKAKLLKEAEEMKLLLEHHHPCVNVETGIVTEKVTTYTGYHIDEPQFFPGWVQPESSPIVECSIESLKDALGRRPSLVTWHFGTDGAYTAGIRGIPTIGFGPSDEKQAHVPNEHVQVEKIIDAFHGYVVLASRLTSLPPTP
ncbi:MAG: YgeY family selenium metabolism-linked hydrolase [Candidatus Ranarchaeia archaeon]